MAIQLYVCAKSKADLNRHLAKGGTVYGVEHKMGDEITHDLRKLPSGTIIKVYEKFSMGSPYAKAYGTWDAEKKIVK